MDAEQRKIELQSSADLRYLLDNARRAAREKIDLNFPPAAAPKSGDDTMRRRVEELVLERTFGLVAGNITINGLEPGPKVLESLQTEEHEPYDTSLATKLQSLHAKLEAESHAVAALRREAPAKAAHQWQEDFGASITADAEQDRQAESIQKPVPSVEWHDLLGGEGELNSLTRVKEHTETWQEALQQLVNLRNSLPGTAARLERGKTVVEHIEGAS